MERNWKKREEIGKNREDIKNIRKVSKQLSKKYPISIPKVSKKNPKSALGYLFQSLTHSHRHTLITWRLLNCLFQIAQSTSIADWPIFQEV